jgi:DNA polymerase V
MNNRGGKRVGAGRPKGAGKYSCTTKPIRVPVDMVEKIDAFIRSNAYEIPLFSNLVSAGFPSPADDHSDSKLDLNSYLIKKPAATFFVRVSGDSMTGVGIHPGDILVVDKSLEPKHNKIVIAAVNSELTVKRLYKKDGAVKLLPENPKYPELVLNNESDLMIWGVVTSVIHQF